MTDRMTYQEKLMRLALALLTELKRMPAYNEEAERLHRQARSGRNGHHPPVRVVRGNGTGPALPHGGTTRRA